MLSNMFDTYYQPVGVTLSYALLIMVVTTLGTVLYNKFVSTSMYSLIAAAFINVMCVMYIVRTVFRCKCALQQNVNLMANNY
jgi:hypothetical protein